MKTRFAIAVLIGAVIALIAVRVLRKTADAHVALVPGTAVEYRQVFELTDAIADGEEQAALRVEHDVTLRCVRAVGEGAWEVAIEYGRTRVWFDAFDGEPALDTTDRGYALVREISASADSDMHAELAAFWATSVDTTSSCVVDTHGYVAEPRIDREVAKRLDDNRAADVGSALLEDALSDPALFFAPLAHGDGPWQGELTLVAALWGPGITFETATRVTERDDDTLSLEFDGTGSVVPAWSEVGATQRAHADELTARRKQQLPRLRLDRHELTGTARVSFADGLPERLEWTLTIDLRDEGDEAWREAATLRHTLERVETQ